MTDAAFQDFVETIMKAHDEAHIARAQLLAKILSARVMNDFVQVADALLLELDPEGLTRRAKGDDDSDVKPLDDSAQVKFQFEAHGADSFDPAAPVDDLEETLTEDSQVNRNRSTARVSP